MSDFKCTAYFEICLLTVLLVSPALDVVPCTLIKFELSARQKCGFKSLLTNDTLQGNGLDVNTQETLSH